MHFILRLFVVCLILALASPAAAAGFSKVGTFTFSWEGIFTGGRLSALGGSDLADRSPATLLVNPAPLSTGTGVGLSYDHADYIGGFEFHTYAGTAGWNHLRLNFAMQDFVNESVLVRTAYNPEGTGETFEIHDRMTAIGLSYDLGRALFGKPSFHWAVGAAWRGYSSRFDEMEADADTWDLGTTFGWRVDYHGGWTGLTGAVSWQNVTDAAYTFDDYVARLPRPLRTGLTVETAIDRAGHPGDIVKFLLAVAQTSRLGDTYRSDADHVGLEALFLDALALRFGHSTQVLGDIESWGLGIVLDGRLLGPVTVELDWGEMSYDNSLYAADKTIWGARARYSF
ncbi:MAG: hypothetical protein ABFS42_10600 [Candidatus Krumholzibacteriota bacterium]